MADQQAWHQQAPELARQRLRSQSIATALFAGVAEVVGWLGAVQSQEYVYLHPVFLDGQYVGGWRRTLWAREVAVDVQLARPLDAAEQVALADAIDRHARFVGLPATAFVNPAPT